MVSTRDCSLQRRHQKLVEEAPAPFLTDEQNAELVRASKAILKAVSYTHLDVYKRQSLIHQPSLS